jgi:hypothetical protein
LDVQSVDASFVGVEPSVVGIGGITEPSLPGLVVEPSALAWPSGVVAASAVLDPGSNVSKSFPHAIMIEPAQSIERARPKTRLRWWMCISRTLLGGLRTRDRR